ncbi:MAG: Twin-arginine translocation pathway signal sequence domain-containing protein, partial [Burkholderiales bacterium]
MKDRREFLLKASALGISGALPAFASAASANERTRGAAEKLVVMVYLKAGNDAYNTLVPLDNPRYYTMRPNIALKREQTILLNPRQGLNRSLQALMPLWQDGQLALLQG